MTEQELNEKEAKNIDRVISSLKSILAYYESKAKPRRPLKSIRWALVVAIELCEKQIAKQPIEGSFGVQCCPCCNEKVGQRVTRTLYENRMNYCGNCGVRIDWGNEDAE